MQIALPAPPAPVASLLHLASLRKGRGGSQLLSISKLSFILG